MCGGGGGHFFPVVFVGSFFLEGGYSFDCIGGYNWISFFSFLVVLKYISTNNHFFWLHQKQKKNCSEYCYLSIHESYFLYLWNEQTNERTEKNDQNSNKTYVKFRSKQSCLHICISVFCWLSVFFFVLPSNKCYFFGVSFFLFRIRLTSITYHIIQ